MTLDPGIEVCLTAPDELAEPLFLLEESLREGDPIPSTFAEQLTLATERGDIEVILARTKPGTQPVGVVTLAFRPSLSIGACFASIEDLYVRPDARRQGVGRALLTAVGERCRMRGVSYIEVQTDDETAPFYRASGYEPEPGVQVLSHSSTFKSQSPG